MTKQTGLKRFALGLVAVTALAGWQAFANSDGDELLSILGDNSGGAAKPESKEGGGFVRGLLGESRPTAEQNIFIQFFEAGQMEKALYQWPSAFEGTEFSRTVNGRALNALVLFKNGMQVTGLESLLAIDNPKAISPALANQWTEAAPETIEAWTRINASLWKSAWSDVFGIATEIRVRGRGIYSVDRLDELKELITKTPVGTRERAWLQWQLVLSMSLSGDPGTAAKALSSLMKVPNNPVGQDLMTLTAARLLFQNGFLDAAIKYYEKVPKTSDDWFDAQEEIAWSYIRKGEPQNALAVTKSLVNPSFKNLVGPETVFLRSLSTLKVCDYKEAVATLNLFRDRYKERASKLMSLAENQQVSAAKNFVSRRKKGVVRLKDLGSDSAILPRQVTRDEVLEQLVLTELALDKEAKQAGDLYARSLSGGTAQVGFQARLEQFKKSVERRLESAQAATNARLKEMAEEEVGEIGQMLQKMHIVEAEILQQTSMADRVIGATSKAKATKQAGTTGSQSKDRIWFPAEQETWFDELANYRVDINKGCQAKSTGGSSIKR